MRLTNTRYEDVKVISNIRFRVLNWHDNIEVEQEDMKERTLIKEHCILYIRKY